MAKNTVDGAGPHTFVVSAAKIKKGGPGHVVELTSPTPKTVSKIKVEPDDEGNLRLTLLPK